MTGYGEVNRHAGGIDYAVEIRTLNNRYFKASIRLPDELASLEARIEQQLRAKIARGSVNFSLRIKVPHAADMYRVNDGAMEAYLEHLETLHQRFSRKGHAMNVDLTALLGLPGVLSPRIDRFQLIEEAGPIIAEMVDEACNRLAAMRRTEGQAIADDLARHCQAIQDRLAIIASRAPAVVDEYHTRLRTRITELLARAELSISQPDLIREVAIFAERSDIAEELARLAGHMEQLHQLCAASDDEPAGRTLDFLAQELLREANTIASKANDATISRAIVEVKGAIDRIKEQVQNVE